jgi:hypothetical protein
MLLPFKAAGQPDGAGRGTVASTPRVKRFGCPSASIAAILKFQSMAPDHVQMSTLCCVDERRPPKIIERVGIGALPQQAIHPVEIALAGGKMKLLPVEPIAECVRH